MRKQNPSQIAAPAILVILLSMPLAKLYATAPIPDAAKPGYDAISLLNLKAFLNFIAADELEGRNTGSRGLKIAANFLISQYIIAGLTPAPGQNSMVQKFDVIEAETVSDSKLSVITEDGKQQAEFKFLEDLMIQSRHRADINADYEAVFVGFGDHEPVSGSNGYDGIDLAGKVMIALDGSSNLENERKKGDGYFRALRALRKSKTERATKAGAAAVILISGNFASTLPMFKRYARRTGQMLADQPDPIPQIIVSESVGEAIFARSGKSLAALKAQAREHPQQARFRLKRNRIRLNIRTNAKRKTTQNVIAYLEGSDPHLKEEVVVLGAHYDHVGLGANGEIYNGADDDGSGTVGILEVARAFAGNKERPKRSLLFISHSGEEKGLLGSDYYTMKPIIPLEKTIVQLNIDMIGRNDPNSVYIIGSNFFSQELHQINESANQAVNLTLDYLYNDLKDPNRFYYRSDHYNYAKHGIPVIFYFAGTHEDYHKPTDTVDKIDFTKIQKISRLAYLTAWQIANLDHDLSADGILQKQ